MDYEAELCVVLSDKANYTKADSSVLQQFYKSSHGYMQLATTTKGTLIDRVYIYIYIYIYTAISHSIIPQYMYKTLIIAIMTLPTVHCLYMSLQNMTI